MKPKRCRGNCCVSKQAADYQAGQSELPVPGVGTHLEGIFIVFWGGAVSGQIRGENAVLAVSGFHFFSYILA